MSPNGLLPMGGVRASYFGAAAGAAGGDEGGGLSGTPLPPPLRSRMERGLDADLGDVRLHLGPEGDAAARDAGALALTAGSHVAFREGQFQPGSPQGDFLIAHELAHTVQQQGASPLLSASPDPASPTRAPGEAALEKDASQAAVAALSADLPARRGPALRAPTSLQRADPMTTLSPTYQGAVEPANDPTREGREGHYIDLDGDQSADVIATLSAAKKDANNKITAIRLELTDIASGKKLAHDFELFQSATATPPQLSLQLKSGDIKNSNGVDAAQIRVATNDQPIVLMPPVVEKDERVVTVMAMWGSFPDAKFQYRFPKLGKDKKEPKQFTVFHPGSVRNTGPIWFFDFEAGAYGDPFQMTLFKPGFPLSRVTVAISPLVEGKPYGAQRFDFDGAPIAALNVAVLPGSATQLAIDLDGDGKADLTLVDQLVATVAEGKYDFGPSYHDEPEKNREHQFRIVDSAVGSVPATTRYGTSVRVSEGHFSPYPFGSEVDFEAASLAKAAESLPDQAKRGDYGTQVISIESARQKLREQAVSAGAISKKLFDAWTAVSDAVVAVLVARGKKEPLAAPIDGAKKALTDFDTVLQAEKPYAREQTSVVVSHAAVVTESVDPYTGETYRAISGVGEKKQAPSDAKAAINALSMGAIDAALGWYHSTEARLDRLVQDQLKAKGKTDEAKQLGNFVTLDKQLQEIATKDPKPVYAVYHPYEPYRDAMGAVQEFPLFLFYWADGDDWVLRDYTNPDKVFTTRVARTAGEAEPPDGLFKTMNRAAHFRRGWVHYQLPSGTTGRVQLTEDKEWSDYLAYTAAALGAAAFILATAGAGSIVVTSCIVAASAAGAASAAFDIKEKAEQGILDTQSLVLDVAQILASVLGGGSAIAREVKLAQEALIAGKELSPAGKMLAGWGTVARAYKPITIAAAAADVVNLIAYTPQALAELSAVDSGGGTSGDRFKAKALILGRLFAQGAMTMLAIRGNWKELEKLGNWEIGFANGRPVARVPAGTYKAADYAAELQAALKGGPGAAAEVEVLSAEAFSKRFQSSLGDAVVAFENGKPKVFVREGAVKSSVLEEAVHVQQAHDPHFGPLLRSLDEATLAKWPTMTPAEKLPLVRAKLELEIDAQKRLIKDLGNRTTLNAGEYVQLDNAWQNLENLRGKFGEWSALQDELAKTKAIAGDPELLKQPPRLFAKKTQAAFDLLDLWKNLTPEDFLKAYKGRYPGTTLSDEEILQRFAQGKRLNPKTWRLHDPTRVENAPPDVEAAKKAGSQKTLTTDPQGEGEYLGLGSKKAERDQLIKARDAARAERDAKLKAGDETAAAKAGYKVNEASRQLGELHAEAYMAQAHPDYVKVYPKGGGSRAGDFDQVWQRVKKGPNGDIIEYYLEQIVIEAKGGSSPLGTAATAEGKRVEQGTRDYFNLIVGKMANGTPEQRATADALKKLGPDGVKYLHVQVPIESGATSTVTTVKVSEFDLAKKTPTP